MDVTDDLEHYQVRKVTFIEGKQEIAIRAASCLEIRLRVGRLNAVVRDLEEETTGSFGKTTLALSAFKRGS